MASDDVLNWSKPIQSNPIQSNSSQAKIHLKLVSIIVSNRFGLLNKSSCVSRRKFQMLHVGDQMLIETTYKAKLHSSITLLQLLQTIR
jgi:hypothetical protein